MPAIFRYEHPRSSSSLINSFGRVCGRPRRLPFALALMRPGSARSRWELSQKNIFDRRQTAVSPAYSANTKMPLIFKRHSSSTLIFQV
jgi:hypothetical protein